MSKLFTVSFAAAAVACVGADGEARADHTIKAGGGFALSTLDPGRMADIKLYDTAGHLNATLTPFQHAGGVNVAAGDVNGDGRADIIVGHASGAEVRAFDGYKLSEHLALVPFGSDFRGGISVAAGDVTGDGRAEIITGAGPGGGPHVRVFEGNGETITQFDAFESKFQGGVRVAVGDLNGDGVGDLLVTAAAGDGSVRTFDGASGKPLDQFFPFGDAHKDGVTLVAGKFLGENVLFASKIAAGDGSVRVISLSQIGRTIDFNPFGDKYRGSLSLGFTSDGKQDALIVGQAEGGTVAVINVTGRIGRELGSFAFGSANELVDEGFFFNPFGNDYTGGISVAGLNNLAVPEPTSWGLMITGFALAGAGVRRRLREDRASVSPA